MNLYVVTNDGSYSNIYVAKAENKRDAIEKVFKKHFEWQNAFAKEDGYKLYTRAYLNAKRLDDMIEDDIAELN